MKATHKLRELRDVARVVGTAPTITEACRRLGVNRSTVHRWIVAGKAPRPGSLGVSGQANDQMGDDADDGQDEGPTPRSADMNAPEWKRWRHRRMLRLRREQQRRGDPRRLLGVGH